VLPSLAPVTVGLPARGKTHISRSLERYLRWLGVKTAVLSLGDYRRKTIGGAKNLPADYFATGLSLTVSVWLSADRFRSSPLHLAVWRRLLSPGPKAKETEELRIRIKDGLEQQALDFFQKEGGQVVIYDANNGIREARLELWARFKAQGVHVIFLGECARFLTPHCAPSPYMPLPVMTGQLTRSTRGPST
jgi:6-phosphofructo-2-kinase/fructose-2,6-biphosphatase 4